MDMDMVGQKKIKAWDLGIFLFISSRHLRPLMIVGWGALGGGLLLIPLYNISSQGKRGGGIFRRNGEAYDGAPLNTSSSF